MQTVKLESLHLNDGSHGLPKNPRFIRDERFAALVASVRDNPEFMPARPIIADEAGVVLGGNQRLLACRELGLAEIPAAWVQTVTGWPVEKKRRFIILDNRGFGEDDREALAADWTMDELTAAGFDEAESLMAREEAPTLADTIAAEAEYTIQHDAAEKRADTLQERIKQLKTNHPDLLNSAKAIVLSSGTNEALIIADDALADVLTELRRYAEQGIDSPLGALLGSIYKL